MRYISLYFFGFPICILVFGFCGIMQRVSPKLFIHTSIPSDTGTSTSLFSDTESLLADVDSCDEDGDEADEGVVEEELADKPGTTINTHAISDEMWILTAFPLIRVPMFIVEFPQ